MYCTDGMERVSSSLQGAIADLRLSGAQLRVCLHAERMILLSSPAHVCVVGEGYHCSFNTKQI